MGLQLESGLILTFMKAAQSVLIDLRGIRIMENHTQTWFFGHVVGWHTLWLICDAST